MSSRLRGAKRSTTKKRARTRVRRKQRPTSKRVSASKQEASLVDESISFHGARLDVDVHNAYRSRLRRHEFTISAERTVTMEEDGVECAVSERLVRLDMTPRRKRRGQKPPYSAFAHELRKRDLQKFPVKFDFDDDGEFLGVTIFR